jgi:hypothetical protein
MLPLEIRVNDKVAIAPIKGHKLSAGILLRGMSFDPIIAEAATLTKYAMYKSSFSVSGTSGLSTISLKVKKVNMYHTKLFATRIMDGAVALQAIFGLFALNGVICETH